MSSRAALSRNLLSLDDKLWSLQVAVLFGLNGAPILQRWVPPTSAGSNGGSAGHYEDAGPAGTEGAFSVRKRTTGDFVVVMQDRYQRVKGVTPTYRNSANLGIHSPIVRMAAGQITAVDTYPDLTDMTQERLEAGHLGKATPAASPTFTISGGGFPATLVGLLLVDSGGAQYTILNADGGDTLTVSGIRTPATGSGWSVQTPQGTIILNTATMPGGASSTAFTAATFTDVAATWLVNRWTGHTLVDATGTRFLVLSNTATVITLQSLPVNPQTVVAGMTGTSSGSVFTITGGGPTASANQYAGSTFFDGVNLFLITANSALTATTGTITVLVGSPAATVTAAGVIAYQTGSPVGGPYICAQGFTPKSQYTVTGTAQVTGSPSGTGGVNIFTPSAHVNWAAGMFAGMTLVDSTGTPWFIETNSTTVLTVASRGSSTTPASGTWTILAVAGACSIEILTGANAAPAVGTLTAAAQAFTGGSPGAAMTGTAATVASATAPAAGTAATFTVNTAGYTTNQWAGAIFVDHNENLWLVLSNTNATNAVVTVVGVAHDSVAFITPASGAGTFYLPVGANATSAVTGTLTAGAFAAADPAQYEQLLLALELSDGTVQG